MSVSTLRFQSSNWSIYTPTTIASATELALEIHSSCLTCDSTSYLIRIQGFRPYVLIRSDLSDTNLESLYVHFCKFKSSNPVDYEIVDKRDLYYDDDTQHKYLKLYFNSETKRSKFHQYVNGKDIQFRNSAGMLMKIKTDIIEFDVKPVRQMLTELSVGYTDWFMITHTKEVRNSILNINNAEALNPTYEVICHYKSIKLANDVGMIITNPLILSFDIETYSDRHNMLPVALFDKHAITMISCVVERLGKPESRLKYLLTHKKVNDFGDTTVRIADSEINMIYDFYDLINCVNPDVIIGYNIFLYDFPYIIKRFLRHNLKLPTIGRLKYVETKVEKIKWESSAYGIQTLEYLSMPGIVITDVFTVISRDHKLNSYSLNNVSQEFIGKTKHDVTPKEMFIAWEGVCKEETTESINEFTRVAMYCDQDSILTIELYQKFNMWIGLLQMSKISGVNMFDLYTGGQQRRCLSRIYDLINKLDIALTTRDTSIRGFRGGLVRDPLTGIHDNVITLDFRSLYPSVIIGFNLCFTTLIKPENLENYAPDDYISIECVIPKDNPTDDQDGDTASNSTYQRDDYIHMNEDEDDDDEVETQTVTFHFLKPHIRKGILPVLCKDLIAHRKAVRDDQKKYKEGSVEWLILEETQKAIKVIANSIFGFTGTKQGKYRIPEVAAAITAKGRGLIEMCKDHLISVRNAIIVYGDTDSVMFKLPNVTNKREALEWGKKMEIEVSSIFNNDALYTEFEKVGRIASFKKKKYLYWVLDSKTGDFKMTIDYIVSPDDNNKEEILTMTSTLWDKDVYKDQVKEVELNGKVYRVTRIVNPSLMVKGVTTARRDNSIVQRELFTNVTNMLMKGYSFEEIFNVIVDYMIKLIQRGYSHDKFIITKKVGKKNYKDKNMCMNLFMQDLKRRGITTVPGERLQFIIVDTGNKDDKLGTKMRLPEHFRVDSLPIDIIYYINNHMKNTIEDILHICYPEKIKEYDERFKSWRETVIQKRFMNKVMEIYDQVRRNKIRESMCDVISNLPDDINIDEIAKQLSKILGLKAKIEIALRESRKRDIRLMPCGNPISEMLYYVSMRKIMNRELIMKYEEMYPKMIVD